jgi:hypothetical protein
VIWQRAPIRNRIKESGCRVGAGFASRRVRPETTTAAHYFRIALETQFNGNNVTQSGLPPESLFSASEIAYQTEETEAKSAAANRPHSF